MASSALTTIRLNKQENSLRKQPIENAFIARQGYLNFYFCIYKLDGDFINGFYFGLLELHPSYPLSAPKLYFYTPNGRYEINMPICTSFTNYHQESWTTAWTIRNLIQGTISFMYSNQPSYGCRQDNSIIRKRLAKQSLQWNLNNQTFRRLFGEQIMSKYADLKQQKIEFFISLQRIQQIIFSNRLIDKNSLNGSQNSQVEIEPTIGLGDNLIINQEETLFEQLLPQKQQGRRNNCLNKRVLIILLIVLIIGALIFLGAIFMK